MRNTGNLKSDKTLKSGGALGGGGKSLSAKTRLKARSEKTETLYRESRIPFVIDFLERHPRCSFTLWIHGTTIEESPPLGSTGHGIANCTKRAVDVHEVFPRGRGGNIVPIEGQDEDDQFKSMCRFHHTFITSRPAWAREKGYTR